MTTAVYMMALQGITQVPFRCVDEINQGKLNRRGLVKKVLKENMIYLKWLLHIMKTPTMIQTKVYSGNILFRVFNVMYTNINYFDKCMQTKLQIFD